MTKTSPISSFLKDFYENIRLFNKLYYFKKWRLKGPMKQDNRLFNRILKFMGKDYDQEIENEGSRLKKGDLIEIELTDDDLKAIYDSMEGINYENLLKFENRYFLLILYSEMEQYLFKSFKYVLTKYPAILKEKSILLNKLLDNNQTINSIIEEKIIDDYIASYHLPKYFLKFLVYFCRIGMIIKLPEFDEEFFAENCCPEKILYDPQLKCSYLL